MLAMGQNRFNKSIEVEFGVVSGNIFMAGDTGYITFGELYKDAKKRNFVSYFDNFGTLIRSSFFGYDSFDFYNARENSVLFNDSMFISIGTGIIGDAFHIDSSFFFVLKYNLALDTLSYRTYMNDTLYMEALGICNTADKGFAMVGFTQRKQNGTLVYENSRDAFMLKIDSSGQQQWYKTFGANTSSHDQDDFYKVIQTPDKGYLCAGYTKSWQTQNFFDKGDWWLIKTDSMGIQQWTRRYGHANYDDGRPYALMMASDTSYYIVGAKVIYNIGGNNFTQSTITKLDNNYNEVYTKHFGPPIIKNCFFSLLENSNHDLILTGYIQPGDEYNEYSERAFMYKLNSNGDSIWRRQYTCTDTLDATNRAYSVKQTTDGGYVFTGIAYDNDLNPAQQIWLVKTDSLGCDGTDWWPCGGHVQINPTVANSDFKMYPNPSKNILFLEIKNDEFKILNAEIYELTGKLVKSFHLEETENGLNISSLPKGLYFVKLGEQTQKLVVE